MLKGNQFNSVFSLAIIDHTLYFIEVLTSRTGGNTMLKYIALLMMVLPTHLLAGSDEAVIQSMKSTSTTMERKLRFSTLTFVVQTLVQAGVGRVAAHRM